MGDALAFCCSGCVVELLSLFHSGCRWSVSRQDKQSPLVPSKDKSSSQQRSSQHSHTVTEYPDSRGVWSGENGSRTRS